MSKVATWGGLLKSLRERVRLSQDDLTVELSRLGSNLLKEENAREKEALKKIDLDVYVSIDKARISRLERDESASPKDRSFHLVLIYYFSRKGVLDLEEANIWLGLADKRNLDNEECMVLFGHALEKDVTKDNHTNVANRIGKPLQRPQRAEHFKGREKELSDLLNSLQPGRVITLWGPGGIGKTALAAEAIWLLAPGDQLPDIFPDGIIYHSFYNQPQATHALEHIAYSFGEEPRPTPVTAAQRVLAGRRCLLLLDGTEQADDLRPLLDIHDQCCVIITSRTRKDAVATRQDILPLALPDAISLLQAWGGQRAANQEIAQRISQLVGRLPLALRLVGRYLTQSEEEASDYVNWLENAPLAALDQGQRQQESVPLLLTRSLNQVSKPAQDALATISVLALAPFTWDAIANGLNIADEDARYALGELVNYGILFRREQSYEVTHALIHTYARFRLIPLKKYITQVANYYTGFVNDHQVKFDQLNSVRSHVMALLDGCCGCHAWESVSVLAQSIDRYLDLQGYWVDRITALKSGLAAAQMMQTPQEESSWLGRLANTYRELGRMEPAIEYYMQALAICSTNGDRKGEAEKLGNLGIVYLNLGQTNQAIIYFQQSLTIAKEIGNRTYQGNQLGNLGLAYSDSGQMEKAIEYHRQALAISREIGDRRGECADLGNLGIASRKIGQADQAIEYYQLALTISREIGDRRNEGNHLGNLANVYSDLGKVRQSIEYQEQAIAIDREIGHRRAEGIRLGNLGNAYIELGQPDQAIEYHQQGLIIVKEVGDRRGEGTNLGFLGNGYLALGQVDRAMDYYQQSLTIAREVGDRRGEGFNLGYLGNAYLALGQFDQAMDYYRQSLNIAKEVGDLKGQGECLNKLGMAHHNLGQINQACQYMEQALQIFEQIKSPKSSTVRKLLESLKSS